MYLPQITIIQEILCVYSLLKQRGFGMPNSVVASSILGLAGDHVEEVLGNDGA
jgi:hypothetical protein